MRGVCCVGRINIIQQFVHLLSIVDSSYSPSLSPSSQANVWRIHLSTAQHEAGSLPFYWKTCHPMNDRYIPYVQYSDVPFDVPVELWIKKNIFGAQAIAGTSSNICTSDSVLHRVAYVHDCICKCVYLCIWPIETSSYKCFRSKKTVCQRLTNKP